ncbi:hypothetical protein [Staphylococcus shinii]|uniref:hypothetical protein n=1 Tax=Staphylococcus shinii TaxID=2912228 RepID=UPI003F85C390
MTFYSTEFNGKFEFNEAVNDDVRDFVNGLSRTRRVLRDEDLLLDMTGIDFGIDGEYFIPTVEEEDMAVIDSNTPPSDQPGLWMDWEITEDGKYLQWTGMEKFRFYLEWLDYLANNVFVPNNIKLNGSMEYQGWDERDKGTIFIVDNQVKLKTDFTYTYGTGVHYEWDEPSSQEQFNEMVEGANELRPELNIPYVDREVTTEEHNLLAGIYDMILADEGEMVYNNEELRQHIKTLPNEVVPEIKKVNENLLSVKFYEFDEPVELDLSNKTPEEKYWAYLKTLNELAEAY